MTNIQKLYSCVYTKLLTVSILFSLFIFVIIRGHFVLRENTGQCYSIHFRHLTKPIDLSQNGRLMETITIISDNKENGCYSVQSYLSDIKLKELLMAEYQLTLNQVIVQSQQLSPLATLSLT
ncbi:hypothetical protein [Streptococcus iniae]|uniref:hypothetical protein n=1 Tax=Streptococcus iniae TaxID=1346 RepID=UPI00217EFE74|nr:hypothetical protein [Streptococcus iniae]